MAVTFLIGRAQTGKTQWCVQRIVDACRAYPLGPPIVFVVPKQATFGVQRRLALASGLPGFSRVRVVSFDRWIDQIMGECGGDAAPAVTSRGRRFILQYLLRELSPKLAVYSRSAGRPGLADELDRTFTELENNGYDAVALAWLLETLAREDSDPSPAQQLLIDKLRDLHLLYGAYQDYLGQDRLDPHRRVRQCVQQVARTPSLRDAHIYVDGHLDFSAFECRLLAAAAKVAADVVITCLMDPGAIPTAPPLENDRHLFHRTQRAYLRLIKALQDEGVPIAGIERLHRPPPTKPTTLTVIEQRVFGNDAGKPAPPDESFAALQLSDVRAEIHAAASIVRQWLGQGRRARDIAVLTRQSAGWHELIQSIFTEHGIATFTDRRRSAAHHPLLQVVWACLQAAAGNFPHESMMALAKSGLAGLSREQADELENYVLEHGIIGGVWAHPDPWTFSHRAAGAAVSDDDQQSDGETDDDEAHDNGTIEPDRVEPIRQRLVAPLKALSQRLAGADKAPAGADKATVRELAVALLSTLRALKVEDHLADAIERAEAANHFELAEVHQQVWSEFIDLLDELVDVIGSERMTPGEFVETLGTALAEFDLAITPPTVDQVLIGDVERTRFEHFPCVILMGMNQGEFPRVADEPSVLGNMERQRLGNRLMLDADTERRLLDEPLLAYIGLTRATERLVVTRHLADEDGRPVNASPFWRDLSRIVAGMPDATAGPSPAKISLTPAGVVAALAGWARGLQSRPDAPAIYQHLVGTGGENPTRRLLEIAWPALNRHNRAQLSPSVVAELFGQELSLSVTQIERFAKCPFQHFAQSVLRLKLRTEPDLNMMDLGTLYHGVLERLVGQLAAEKKKWNPALRPSRQAIAKVVAELGDQLRGQLALASPRNQYLLQRLASDADTVLLQQLATGQLGRLRPAGVELPFGRPSDEKSLDPLVLHTPNHRVVRLSGKIDRVDLCEDPPAGAVFDYKLTRSDKKLPLSEVYHGLALQLVTYLLVLQANGQKLAGRPLTPIAAFYVRLLQEIKSVNHPEEAPDPDGAELLLVKRRGVIDSAHTKLVASGEYAKCVLYPSVNKDGSVREGSGDELAHEVFLALLDYVRETICRLADQLADGDISVQPYRMGDQSPCARCDYRPVCRFEPPLDHYRYLARAERAQVIAWLKGRRP